MSTIYTETLVAQVLESESTIIFSGDIDVKRIDHKGLSPWHSESKSMSLDELEEIICELRQAGANRVEITYHVDHGSYHFVGTKLEEDLDPKAELALRISDLRSDLEVRKSYRKNYQDNLAAVEKIIERDTVELDNLLKEYESK